MSGALIQLCAYGEMNANFKNLYSSDYVTYNLNDNKNHSYLTILRNADLCIPLYLSFTTTKELTSEEFMACLNNMNVTLEFGTYQLYKINLALLAKMNPIKKVNSNYILKLPFNYLMGKILLISLSFCCVKLTVENKHNDIDIISTVLEYVYLDTSDRGFFARNIIYQNMFDIRRLCINEFYENKRYSYDIDFNEHQNKLGLFIESSNNKIEDLKIHYNDKVYSITDCEIINDKLVYFSFVGLKFLDKNNRYKDFVKIGKIIVSSKTSNINFYEFTTETICYINCLLNLFSQIHNKYSLFINNKPDYNMNISLTNQVKLMDELLNKKVYNFYNKTIKKNDLKNVNLENCVIQFYACTLSSDTIIPDNVSHIIFENCAKEFTNIPSTVTELWLIHTYGVTNFPFSLEKLKLCGKYNLDDIKVPFGCKLEYIEM